MIRATVLFLAILISGTAGAGPGSIEEPEPIKRTLRVYVDNVKKAKGTIWIGIYESEDDFLDREKARLVYLKITEKGRAYLDIPDLTVGKEYALGIFHDENDNGEFDLNWLGLPAEPWAFSGLPKTRLRLPYFTEVSFRFNAGQEQQRVRLRKW